jgi:hypothetical protein
MRNSVVASAVAILLGYAASPGMALASVTYHFAESTGEGNVTSGAFSAPGGVQVHNPFTFDFTVADALAPSTSYTFGAAGALGKSQAGVSGDVLDFSFSDGFALSTFGLGDYPAIHEGYRGGPAASDTVRIGVTTDAFGAIGLYDILIVGRSTDRPNDVLSLQLQHDTPSAGVGLVLAAYEYGSSVGTYRFVDGDLRCVIRCGGGFTSIVDEGGTGETGGGGAAAAVPEPASWALMIMGFAGIGAMARRQRAVGQDDVSRRFKPAANVR